MDDKVKLVVMMDVTVVQALALKAMFDDWTRSGAEGRAEVVGFYVDGPGGFQPNCVMMTDRPLPEVADLAEAARRVDKSSCCHRVYDQNILAGTLRDQAVTSSRRFRYLHDFSPLE